MTGEFRIISFEPLKADDALWELYFDLSEELYREANPGEPMLPRARRRERTIAAEDNPYTVTRYYLALAADGRPAGLAYTVTEKPASPTYAANRRLANLHGLSVAPAYRRRGLGTRLLRHAAGALAAADPEISELMVPAAQESGQRFMEARGARVALVHGENRLYLADVDWSMVERWDAEGERRNPATEILAVVAIPQADIEDYARAYTETINQQPLGELNYAMAVTPEQIRFGEKKSAEQGLIETTIYTREPDGRVSGLTETAYMPDLPHVVRQMLTGVRVEYRGRGLGKLLKARMLLHIRRHWPGAKYVATGNADSNAPMMAINNKLGFKKHRPVLLYKLKLSPELLQGV